MARVTVEDCVIQVPNRFELVMLAAHRARALGSGADLKVGRDRDKNPVVALREIAETKLELGGLEESLIKSLQKRIEPEQIEEEVAELVASEQQTWAAALDAADDTDIDDADSEDDDSFDGESGNSDSFSGTFENTDDSDLKD